MTVFDEDLSGKTVLIVEDNENSNSYFKAALHKFGVTTLSAGNGKQAVQMFGENKQIDLVLMDLNMPEMDGFEATQKIKSMRPEVPVIAQSAYILSGEEKRSIEAGCDEFLAKPIRLSSLVDVLQRYLR
ncbi:response regulator [uncultured Sunxiuqinia sp.]|uniref:response regulator n=1 Tax=uncultured Sunxiuqinia sp. TaxID=1573825 RepID=UPI0030DA3966|tara:strand:- start:28007 stop:28393 length:387 start_codon:yes stop_codon:yes gene_type:complete